MADDYTPSINALRADYIALHTRNFDSYMTGRSLTSEQEHYGREFDAALAEHDAEVAAQARADADLRWRAAEFSVANMSRTIADLEQQLHAARTPDQIGDNT